MPNQFSTSIEKDGLKNHLESTKSDHNGEGYERFIFYLTPEFKLKPAAIGRLMNVSRNTIRKWIAVHRKEQGK